MINFRTHLQKQVELLVKDWVGSSVKTFDSYLHDVEIDQMPYMVVNVRTAEKAEAGEIGTAYDLYMWTVHIYYLDITADYVVGDERRNTILSTVQKRLEENRRLGNLELLDSEGGREYVYDSSISAALFDSSGQEEYYSFVSELYLNVYTAKT